MSSLNVRFSLIAVGLVLLALLLGVTAGLVLSQHYPNLLGVGDQIQVEHLALSAFVFVGLCGIGFYGYLARALKPISTLCDHFMRMRSGDLNVRLVEDGPMEMVRLARAFNDTVRSLELQARDVTEEKEEAVRTSQFYQEQISLNARFASYVESAPYGVVLSDLDLNIVYQNPVSESGLARLATYLDWGTETLVGTSMIQFFSGEAAAAELLSDPDHLPHEWTVSAGPHSLRCLASALFDAEGNRAGTALLWEEVAQAVTPPEAEFSQADVDIERPAASVSPENDVLPSRQNGTSNAGRLQRSVKLVGRSVQLLSDRITTVQSMVEALGNEGDNLRRCLEETRQRTRNAAHLTSERSEVLWRLVQEAVDFAERRRSSGAVLRRLRKRLEEMEGLKEAVSRLAITMESMVLNARIEFGREAEGAGGLRIIVDEIQKLGRKSGRMSKDVETKVARVRTDVDEFVNMMEDERRGNRLGGRLGRRAERVLERIEQDLQDVDARADLLGEITFAHTEIGSQVADQLGKLFELVQAMVPVTREQARIVEESTIVDDPIETSIGDAESSSVGDLVEDERPDDPHSGGLMSDLGWN